MNITSKLVLAMLILISTGANLAMADSFLTFTTPVGSTEANSGQPVSALATFSIVGDTLALALTNTQPGMSNAGQLLTDVFFSLSGSGTPALSSATAGLINVAKDGSVTDLGSSPLGWAFGSATVNSISGFEVCVICQGGAGPASATPSQGILGPASADGRYDSANASIAGNKPHNSFVNQTATFQITGIPAGATVGDVIFSFSTVPGDNVPATVPEPSTLALLCTGLVSAGLMVRKRLGV